MKYVVRKLTVPCDANGSLRPTPGESKTCKFERDGYYLDFGFFHRFWPMSDPRPMAPSFRKTLERALPRLQREKTSWRDWR